MSLGMMAMKSTENYSEKIEQIREKIEKTEAIVIWMHQSLFMKNCLSW